MSNFEKQLSSNIKWQPEMSLCIPRMETSTSIDFIITTFNRLNLCKINKIIELPIKNTIGYKRVILNVVWHHTDTSEEIIEKLTNGESIKIVYGMPWYWKLMLAAKKK